MNQDEMNKRAEELAKEHWKYIEKLLEAHGEDIDHVAVAEFHYLEAFKHGYKHCWEDYLDRAYPTPYQFVELPNEDL